MNKKHVVSKSDVEKMGFSPDGKRKEHIPTKEEKAQTAGLAGLGVVAVVAVLSILAAKDDYLAPTPEQLEYATRYRDAVTNMERLDEVIEDCTLNKDLPICDKIPQIIRQVDTMSTTESAGL